MAVSSNMGTPTGPDRSLSMWCALGLMSGTSLDGIDVAMVETDGCHRVIAGPALTISYPREFRERLRSVLGGVGPIAPVEDELTRLHAGAVGQFLQRYPATAVDIVGFHGHTILHRPAVLPQSSSFGPATHSRLSPSLNSATLLTRRALPARIPPSAMPT